MYTASSRLPNIPSSLGRPEAGCMLKMAELPANVFPIKKKLVSVSMKNMGLTIFLTTSVTYDYESFVTICFSDILLFCRGI